MSRSSLLVVCPSFRRPQQARKVVDTFYATQQAASRLSFVCWVGDETFTSYPEVAGTYREEKMVARSNAAVGRWLGRKEPPTYIGWVADDMRFLTVGWDVKVIGALQKTPVVFCNDTVSPGTKPSHVFMDARIPKALGWFIHPQMRSTFFDDVWGDLGRELGITYLDDVKIPHLYTEHDNEVDFLHDLEVYQRWWRDDLEIDVARARAAFRPRRNARPDARYALSVSQPRA